MKYSIVVLMFALISCSKEAKTPMNSTFAEESENSFEYFEVSGSYFDIGKQIGKQFKANIKDIIQDKSDIIDSLQARLKNEPWATYSREVLELSRNVYPQYIEELEGMAQGAEVDFDVLWALNIKSELAVYNPLNAGNSTVLYKNAENTWLTHNIDGHAIYDDQLFVVKVKPQSGVDFYTVVFPSMLFGSGPTLNNNGIGHTSNYISSSKSKVGIPRALIGRALAESKDIEDAIKISTQEPRAFPWHHNIISFEKDRYISVETNYNGRHTVKEPEGLYLHTNHVINDEASEFSLESEVKSSDIRMKGLENLYKGESKFDNPDMILERLSSTHHKEDSPCRHPHGDFEAQTLGTAFFNISNHTMRIFKGFACQSIPDSNYTDYSFEL